MKDEAFHFDYFDHGHGVHLGHYRCRYTSPQGVKFYLWHQYLCHECKVGGLLKWWGEQPPPKPKPKAPEKKSLEKRSASY